VPNSEHSGFGFMPNPGVYPTYLCGLELAELGTLEWLRECYEFENDLVDLFYAITDCHGLHRLCEGLIVPLDKSHGDSHISVNTLCDWSEALHE
jgi:hypothetical protein